MTTRPTENIKVTLADGIERVLRYSLRTMREAAEDFGAPINSIETLKRVDESNLGKLIWYGLRKDSPDLTVEDVEDLIEPPMYVYLMEQYAKALSAGLPEPTPEKNAAEPVEATPDGESTGSQSGLSPDTTSASMTATSGT